jgi:hypothetical protein
LINDLPDLITVNKAVYADDLLTWTTEKYTVLTTANLNKALLTISNYTKAWKMNINKEKQCSPSLATAEIEKKGPHEYTT